MVRWTVTLALLLKNLVDKKTHHGIYDETKNVLNVFQVAAILEIFHAAIGIVKSGVVLTAFQVYSRVLLVFMTHTVMQVQNNVGVTMFISAWSVAEIVRYSFYVSSLLGSVSYVIQWCRYTFFIVLYPIGVTGELVTLYLSLPYIKGMYSFGWVDLHKLVILSMIMYIPVFPKLYGYMLGQRKKVIGGQKPKAQ